MPVRAEQPRERTAARRRKAHFETVAREVLVLVHKKIDACLAFFDTLHQRLGEGPRVAGVQDRAQALLERAVAMAPGDPELESRLATLEGFRALRLGANLTAPSAGRPQEALPWIERAGHGGTYAEVQAQFVKYGVWIMFVAAFTPIPFKVFTVAGGAAAMPLLPFALASLVGRGMRFFLVAGLIAWGGPRIEPHLRRYIEVLGWVVAVAILGVIAWLQLRA